MFHCREEGKLFPLEDPIIKTLRGFSISHWDKFPLPFCNGNMTGRLVNCLQTGWGFNTFLLYTKFCWCSTLVWCWHDEWWLFVFLQELCLFDGIYQNVLFRLKQNIGLVNKTGRHFGKIPVFFFVFFSFCVVHIKPFISWLQHLPFIMSLTSSGVFWCILDVFLLLYAVPACMEEPWGTAAPTPQVPPLSDVGGVHLTECSQ